ncbi:nucleic acid/nucleotide deaminase domain-containing protein [Streptomyces sp. NPDC050585]|uniref:WXG100-like domain-containing protein n=1 Tax=unclassified Streptomyces TaxID=2593676 RepID=UPI0037A63327
MGKQLPDELVEVLDLVGVNWPNIDEDEVRESATDYRNLAVGLRDVIAQGNKACSHIVAGRSKGKTVDAIDRRWGKLTTKDLSTFSKSLDDLADALDDCASFIEGCKIACIAELSATAATATAGVVGMFFTAGLSGLLSAAAIVACRIALNEAIDYAIEQIALVVTEKIEGRVLGKIEDLFTDRFDAGDDARGYAVGSADMAMDLVIEFDEFDKASGGYDETKRDFEKKKITHKTGSAKRRSSVNKDSRFHKLATVMDKAEDAVDKKVDETVDVLEKHGGKIDASKKEHKKADTESKEDIDSCKVPGDVPMYLVNLDGSIVELHTNGTTTPVGKNDDSGIHLLMTEDGGKRAWRPRDGDTNPYPVGVDDTKRVESKPIAPGSTDLARATQTARYAKKDWTGNNYAAGRFIDDKGHDFILVGHSKSVHSERAIGYPLLKANQKEHLKSLYTEREPCQKPPSYCDRWTAKWFGEGIPVTHSQSYDQSLPKREDETDYKYRRRVDAEHIEYRKNLKNWYKTHTPETPYQD